MIGASINPMPSPSDATPTKTCVNDVAEYNINHPNKCGIFTKSMAFLRPIGSVIMPETALPNIVSICNELPKIEVNKVYRILAFKWMC